MTMVSSSSDSVAVNMRMESEIGLQDLCFSLLKILA